MIFFLEEYLAYPFTKILTRDFAKIDLKKYSIIIYPDGGYENYSPPKDKLNRWVVDGGKLILMEGGLDLGQKLRVAEIGLRENDIIKNKKRSSEPNSRSDF